MRSKRRPQWHEIPASDRANIERVLGGRVVAARNCPGGYSPGFASQLTLADGRRVFVKMVDASRWPDDASLHRAEARTSAALPSTVPAPRLLRSFDEGRWTGLAFECVDGVEPRQPWDRAELVRTVAAAVELTRAVTLSPVELGRDQPRLGGWAGLAGDAAATARLAVHSPWAARNLPALVRLEADGLAAARGDTLVHFDLYPHNVLLTRDRVVFVDWPHARLGAPGVDLLTLLISAAADGIDPEPMLRDHGSGLREHGGGLALDTATVDALLAAHAGFLVRGGLSAMPAGLEAIGRAKRRLGLAALTWLHRRLTAIHP
nr:phosphotransferase [Micromonospora sp. DSM 115978]